MDYLTLTNQVLAELNEVQLTSSNFVSGAVQDKKNMHYLLIIDQLTMIHST